MGLNAIKSIPERGRGGADAHQGGHVITEAASGVMQPSAKEGYSDQKLEEVRTDFPLQPEGKSGVCSPSDILITAQQF